MPVPTSAEDFVQVTRKSKVIPEERLDAFLVDQPPILGETPQETAERMQAAGLLTAFQAEQMLQGKWVGFLVGKYRILERLGSGGMGTVYLCEHVNVRHKVAVKVLPRSHAKDPSALARFYREARAAGSIDHPNLVKAHDIDQDGEVHFLVMDYVNGASLQELVARVGPLPVPRACHYVHKAAEGLHAAHEAGLIHRDVKPANVMIDRNGTVRVLDLGLAKFFNDDVDQLTLQYDYDNILGTPDYVAPEQAMSSHEADPRCDIYSLGATFYFLLTGRPPFAGGKPATKLIRHQVSRPASVRDQRPDVPAGVEAVLERMMAKDPAARYQSLAEAAADLVPLIAESVPPPSEAELSKVGTNSWPTPRRAENHRRAVTLPRRSSQAEARPAVAPMSSGLRSHVPASELATPNAVASSRANTATNHPLLATTVPITPPSKRPTAARKPRLARRDVLLLIVVAMLSGLIGVALAALIVVR